VEDEFVDFYYERNVPFMLSKQGPKGATGDVNGDGLTDIFIGGAKGQAAQLYLQTGSGFVKKVTPDFSTFSFNDVTAATFFDCDGDGDLDLFVGGGGNFSAETTGNFQNLLYLNDGTGVFILKRGGLPLTTTNCGAVVPIDFDGDGRLDLFVGSRSVPLNYGASASSYLLHNEGNGSFTDVTATVAPLFTNLGMITGAALADADGDGKNDLVVVGEWMPPRVFSYDGKTFREKETNLKDVSGWWQSVVAADVDNDGDTDLVLGNLGENFYLRAGKDNPVKLWMKDFDGNATTDKIFTQTTNGRDIPVFTKREITEQIPSLKKLNLKHQEYALKTVQDLFGKELDGAAVKSANYLSTCVAYNDGKGRFSLRALPLEAQLSSVNAIAVTDVNGDGLPDILTAGNNFNFLPQFCRLDASYGNVFLNDAKGGFRTVAAPHCGLNVKGEVRDILRFQQKGEDCFLFLQNNDVPVLYQRKKIAAVVRK
jgi:hypothetical protein